MESYEQNRSARQRALNLVWTAAGEYGFEPDFLAFTQDGKPDFYMNSVIGYVRKWYGGEELSGLFDAVGLSLMRETLDGVLWIGLENCAYEREVRERPVLSELRLSCAEQFFDQQFSKSRQQWMAQNSLVYALQAARWNTVLGRAPGLVNPWERRLFNELSFSGNLNSRQLAEQAARVLRTYFRFDADRTVHSPLLKLKNALAAYASRALPSRVIRSEDLTFARDTSGNGIVTARRTGKKPLSGPADEAGNLAYIENCFGLPMYSREDSSKIEQLLCTDRHEGMHLYFTDGKHPVSASSDPLILRAVRGAQAQAAQNRLHYRDNRHFYQNSIRRLSSRIQNAMLVYPQPLKVRSRTGQLFPSEMWRAVYLNDERVFSDVFREERPDFSVDLMLDASASRLQSQEIIAAQAYVIAQSLRECRIPVQVFSFLSLRGYTVMRRFCGYSDSTDSVFDYFAAGWNRDGLALRGAGYLMSTSRAEKRILIVLTDASPNDDRKLPPAPGNGRPNGQLSGHLLSRDYSGDAGVEDTAEEVRRLRKSGTQVMAILNGSDGDTRAARKIYGNDFVRIEDIKQMAGAVGALLQKKIADLSG